MRRSSPEQPPGCFYVQDLKIEDDELAQFVGITPLLKQTGDGQGRGQLRGTLTSVYTKPSEDERKNAG